MAHINFKIPIVVSELLQDNCEHYYVKEAINAKRIAGKLKGNDYTYFLCLFYPSCIPKV